jgi:hypothetical protein
VIRTKISEKAPISGLFYEGSKPYRFLSFGQYILKTGSVWPTMALRGP